MALTPGGGRSPSAQPPPTSTPPGQQRSVRGGRKPSRVASYSLMRWGVLIGGLVIIADLGAQAMSQRTVSADDLNAIGDADEIINWVLFSILGILVVRDSGLIYLGAVAGVFASLLDAIVVAAAASLAPPAGPEMPIEEYLVRNVTIGILFAGISGVVFAMVKRRSSGPPRR